MLRLTLKGIWANKRRLVGTLLAITIGVAFLSGTTVLGDTLRANFSTLFSNANAGTDAVVRSATEIKGDNGGVRPLISQDIVNQVQAVDGVAVAEPEVQGYGQIIGRDGKALGGNGPPTSAGNWIPDKELNPYKLKTGRPPQADGEVVLSESAADLGDFKVGDRVTVQTPEPVEVTVVGIASFAYGESPSTFAGFTLPAAQDLVTKTPGKITEIDIRADDGVSQEELVKRLEPTLPPGTEAVTGKALTKEDTDSINSDFLDSFTTFLTIFAGVALAVATFSIYNTFSIIVAQRSRESALLRAIGASRRQVLGSVAIEAFFIGLLASIVGLLGGLLVAAALKGVFAGFGFPLPTGGVVFKLSTVVTGLIVGLGVTLVAGIVPAVRASRVSPMAALRETATESVRFSPVRAVIGVLMTAAGVALVLTPVLSGSNDLLAVAGLGAALTILGVVVLGPTVARPSARIIGSPLSRLRGITGVLARENAMRNPRRTSGTAAALLIGVAVVTLFTVFAASIKSSIDSAVTKSFGGDLVVSSGNFGSGISPQLAADVNALPEVADAAGIGVGNVLVSGDSQQVVATDTAKLARLADLDLAIGSLDLNPDQVAVSKSKADSEGWKVGTPLPITYPDGTKADLSIGAIYRATDLLQGTAFLLPESGFGPHAVQQLDVSVLVGLRPGVSLADGKQAVEKAAEPFGSPRVEDRQEYADSVTANINQALGLIYIMLALAVIIALMGIANTLSLSVYERTRELGLLRAVGETRGQMRAMVRWESVIIAVFGAVGGVAIGVFLSWALVKAAGSDGQLSGFAAPPGQLLVILLVGAAVGLLAGVRPARRASKLNILDAIATG